AARRALNAMTFDRGDGLILDVGCGRGRAQEYLGVPSSRVVHLDNSAAMLRLAPREGALARVLHRAEELPFLEKEFECVAAFLCDAFLGLNFLAEARRVLRDGGRLIGTTPSFEWGTALRDSIGIDRMTTKFMLRGGTTVTVPSALYSPQQFRMMLIRAGFNESSVSIVGYSLPTEELSVSPDIVRPAEELGISPYNLNILTVFSAQA
ncbi:MAG: class I SAM-dependent methyltransferase, partial [Actinobacteria bacterium]|nr:class I SAM-dependent methyltransferase [Actinomycetota bacterium]